MKTRAKRPKFKMYDVVKLKVKRGMFPAGTVGTIVEYYPTPEAPVPVWTYGRNRV